jgi:hypothetical protein
LSSFLHCRVTFPPVVTLPLWWARREGLDKYPAREEGSEVNGKALVPPLSLVP